ncbi:hypothetical protein [Bradyrhizobium lablabi]|uniref:hypothetical protein n=1 Tax=Bradyrhizobium lablabi TaxID=722472 RepID=UPI001BAC058E|nr:hypothetical protein [Bradyrhizobium lablabi]MBR0694248.1 hypothetical protein [Bradyrhizobium lablabi]
MKLSLLTAAGAVLFPMTAAIVQAQPFGLPNVGGLPVPGISNAQPAQTRQRSAPPPSEALKGTCGGFGSLIIKWIEETAEDYSTARFANGLEARKAVMKEAKSKFDKGWPEIARQNPNGRWAAPDGRILVSQGLLMPARMGSLADYVPDDQTLRACFPTLAKLIADTDTRVVTEQQAETARQAAEAERQAATAKRLAEEEAERRRKAREREAELRAAAEEQAKREAEEQRVAAEKRRVAAEEQAKREADAAAIRAAEQKVAAEQRARREAEVAAIRAEEERTAAAEAAKRRAAEEADEASPHGQVRRAYAAYALVRYCYQIREGYAVKYINDVEMERAEVMIKAVVVKWKKEEPGMDTDLMWTQAMQRAQDKPIDAQSCTRYYAVLGELSPVPAISIQKPL